MRPNEFRRRYPYAAFAAVVLVLVVIVTVVANYARTEGNRDRIDRLGSVQQQLIEDRKRNDARFIRSDRLLCREIEKIKARNRVDAIMNYHNLDRNLRLLGIRKTPEIALLAKQEYLKGLRQTKPVDCKAIPPR